ncbi:MAG TPA: carboxypeptidase [Xanthobacteraceae bacterium]|jgi:carboxypeptidase C (cathepsin A)|nr:carboxypeptidase [Xanthobacteraceae bacterium]
MINLPRTLAAVLLASLVTAAAAQDHPGHGNAEHAKRGEQGQRSDDETQRGAGPGSAGMGVLSLLPADSVTEHSIGTKAGTLAYTATAGTFPLFDQSGAQSASVFYTAYVAKTENKTDNKTGNPSSRPVTFVFNGGPGAASAFLNLGLVGPRIAEFGADGRDGSQTRLVDNPDTWLAFTDLVLIDPIGTGWSRAAKSDDSHVFWGVQADADSMAKVIALYVAKNGRASSPKFILGESYGGFRAAKVARALQEDQGIVVSGILMVSPMLDGNFQFGGDHFALGAALQLPSLAAAELERNGAFSSQALAQAEHFALTDYLTTLAGPPLQGDAAKAFYARVAKITGVSEDALARSRGFIRDDYIKNLAAEHKIVSHYDATFASDDPYPETPADRGPDPILDGMIRAYGGAFVGYARDELGFKTEMTYNLLDGAISRRWDWDRDRDQPSVMDDLRELLALTPSFRLMIAHGYSDMVTPYAVTRYLLQHLPPLSGGPRTALKLYRGGHMFYLDPDSREAFTADARTMYPPP